MTNIAAAMNVGHEIDLPALDCGAGQFSRYNPETFAGLVYQQDNIKITFFRNGKVNATGITNLIELKETETYIRKIADMFRLKTLIKE